MTQRQNRQNLYVEALAYARQIYNSNQKTFLNQAFVESLKGPAMDAYGAWGWRGVPGQRQKMRAELIALANANPASQKWLCERLALALERKEAIPKDFQQWLIAFLRDPVPPASKRGRPDNSLRDELIRHVLKELRRQGLTVTLNDESQTRESACDVVAEVWGLNYSAVAKVWRGKK